LELKDLPEGKKEENFLTLSFSNNKLPLAIHLKILK